MTVERPLARIICKKSQHDMRLCWDRNCIPSHGILEIPGRWLALAIHAFSPPNNLSNFHVSFG